MKIKFIEASSYRVHPDGSKDYCNYGKFMLQRFEATEWAHESEIEKREGIQASLLVSRGWTNLHLLVFDIQTGEGAIFRPGGFAKADLDKHAIWVCPLFEPFLTWLYKQDLTDLDKLPNLVELDEKDAPFELRGYRRPGPKQRGGREEMSMVQTTKRLTKAVLEAVLKEVLGDIKFTIGYYPNRSYFQVMLKDDNLVEFEARKAVEVEDAIALSTGLTRSISIGIWGGEKSGYYLYLSIRA